MSYAAREPEPGRAGWALGVDFGTVTTVAVLAGPDGMTEPLEFDGTYLLSSTVFVTSAGALLAGRPALEAAETGTGWLVTDAKRQLGQDYLRMDGASVPPVEAAAAILRRVAAAARRRIGVAPDIVAVGYPGSWSRAERAVLIEAAVTAGLPEPMIVPEPICVAHYIEKVAGRPVFPGNLMALYDFGGGYVEASLVRREPDGFRVVDRAGLPYGGNDLDEALCTVATRQAHIAGPEVEPPGPLAARRARERLSVLPTVQVPVGMDGVVVPVERADFEDEIHGQLTRTARMTAELIDRSGAQADGLVGLFLIGGVVRTPLVANLYRAFRHIPLPVDRSDFAVAVGALLSLRPTADVTRLPLLPEQPSQDVPPVPVQTRAAVPPATPPRVAQPRRRLAIPFLAVLVTVAALFAIATSWPDDKPPTPVSAPELTTSLPVWSSQAAREPAPLAATTDQSPSVSLRATAPPSSAAARATPSRAPRTLVAPRPSASPPFSVPATFTLVAVESGLCVTPDQPYDGDAVPMRLQTCSGTGVQQWRQHQLGNGAYVLRNVATGKCMDMSISSGAYRVESWLCQDNANQAWKVRHLGAGETTLQVAINQSCLASTQQYPGGRVEFSDCGSARQSRWRLSNG